ncbi:MAG: cation:proton antiporter [Candidatus Melainabacteria bacterium]|nr:cation:proton antiporter [Candidatus Melainabacteria bacterium]
MVESIQPFLTSLIVALVVAKLFGEACQRLGQSPVLGELLAGTLIGAYGLGWIEVDSHFHLLAELGVLFLLFEIGLETNLQELLHAGRQATQVAVVGMLLPLASGYAVGYGLGLPSTTCILLGATLSATSIGITARTLADLNLLHSREGSVIIGAAVLDDILGLLLLALVTALIQQGSLSAWTVADTVIRASLFLGISLTLGPRVLATLLQALGRLQVPGGFICGSLAIIFLLAVLGDWLKVSLVVGAFVAGLLFHRTADAQRVHEITHPLGAWLTPLFFVSIGASLNPSLLNPLDVSNQAHLWLAFLVTVVAIFGKFLAGFAARPGAYQHGLIGAGMVPRGEVGLIFIQVGQQLKVLDHTTYAVLILTVLVTTFVTPPLLKWLQPRHRQRLPIQEQPTF